MRNLEERVKKFREKMAEEGYTFVGGIDPRFGTTGDFLTFPDFYLKGVNFYVGWPLTEEVESYDELKEKDPGLALDLTGWDRRKSLTWKEFLSELALIGEPFEDAFSKEGEGKIVEITNDLWGLCWESYQAPSIFGNLIILRDGGCDEVGLYEREIYEIKDGIGRAFVALSFNPDGWTPDAYSPIYGAIYASREEAEKAYQEFKRLTIENEYAEDFQLDREKAEELFNDHAAVASGRLLYRTAENKVEEIASLLSSRKKNLPPLLGRPLKTSSQPARTKKKPSENCNPCFLTTTTLPPRFRDWQKLTPLPMR